MVVRSVYGHMITKFSGMGRFTKLWGSAQARAKVWSSAINALLSSLEAFSFQAYLMGELNREEGLLERGDSYLIYCEIHQ